MSVQCPFPGCDYAADHADAQIMVALLNIHAKTHSQTPTHPAAPQPKLDRPRIDMGVEEEVWNNFIRRWEAFKIGSSISEDTAPMQLFQCASEALGDLILKAHPGIQTESIVVVKQTMRELAVIPVAIGVRRAELMDLKQLPDEPFRTFAAKTKGKAETCAFTTTSTCSCNRTVKVDYTTETVRDVLLAGIADLDIRREALSTMNMQNKTINEVIAFVESREMARNATPSTTLSALSSFRKKQPTPAAKKPTQPDIKKSMPCPDCGKMFNVFKQRANGSWNTKAHTKCINCWRSDHRKSQEPTSNSSNTIETVVTQIGAIDTLPHPNNNIISKKEIKRHRQSDHPRVNLTLTQSHTHGPEVTIKAVADSGAMSNLWSMHQYLSSGFKASDLQKVRMNIRAANKNRINIIGAFEAVITGQTPTGSKLTSTSLVYVSDSVNDFFLSFDTMLDLRIINAAFPTIGACNTEASHTENRPKSTATPTLSQETKHIRSINSGCTKNTESEVGCKCPQRESMPPRPRTLPFDPIPENNDRMRNWLLDRYSKSTFNTCPHRPLPCMTGPPIEIHIDESATPKTCHTPAPIPIHWQEEVKNNLLQDVALGVIEEVPYGEPVQWCHRMVVTRKHDGSPRRTVDLSPLNRYCKRETFPAESPFRTARRIPGKSWKTVTDAWNGYHSVPLRESDRQLTTFITPFGRYRYTRAPQGYLSSGDGYNRRFDAILSDFERKERCVDDTCHYDDVDNLEGHWWRTIDLLSTCGAAGIVLNPDKFQFAQMEVDFAGFNVTKDKILPLPKYIEAIRSFPTPTSTTDIRSWFGLINQVANYAQLRDALELFRPFLSPKHPFSWTPTLDKAFEESKEIIIEAIREGVQIFDIEKTTCLRPDWSKKGIGYSLLQKHCNCESMMPDCCTEGWRITLAGSRFLNGAEQRYAAIEGEALAVAWGLEQTKYFTQGCRDLLVVTDHKPLKKIFGDRTLDEIPNSRLFRLKQRTLPWQFRIEHMPGKTNSAADAMSRYPAENSDSKTPGDVNEIMIAAAMNRELENVTATSWDQIAAETIKDQQLSILIESLSTNSDSWKEVQELHEFARYSEAMYTSDGVILYHDRIVVPRSLRKSIVENLHAAHQGVPSMERRAKSIVFWPGMTDDIQQTRAKCSHCNANAPSQPQLPSTPAKPPSTPFEKIFADFFDFGGNHYLVIGDRLSGWPEVYSTPAGSSNAGARGLIACLRKFFATFGVPEEISSDGGPEFTASETKTFFTTWGVKHRKSAAYHPQSNGRAEVAVKSVKRLLRANITPSGSLNNDKFLRGLLQLRNTPDPDCSLSPAEIIFGKPLRDAFSFANRLEKFRNKAIHSVWRDAWAAKENALRARFVKTSEKLNEHARFLKTISMGDRCFVQNQTGNYPKRWDRTGVVVEVGQHDQYAVKIDGSGRITIRNRRFLRKFEPATMDIQPAPTTHRKSAPEITPHPSENFKINKEPPIVENGTKDIPSTVPPEPELQPASPSTPPPPALATRPASTEKVPTALKRLISFNKEGLKEARKPPEEDGRKTRSNNRL